jgi:hypothetical protein
MITPYLEQLIHQGKAAYRSKSIGVGETFNIDIPRNGYIVIFEYYYKPFFFKYWQEHEFFNLVDEPWLQYVNFVSEEFFHPYAHYPNPTAVKINPAEGQRELDVINYNIPDHQKRNVYIIARKPFNIYFTQAFSSNPDPGDTEYQILPIINPVFANVGYGGQNALVSANQYHRIAPQQSYAPLTQQFSLDYLPIPTTPYLGAFDQLYFEVPSGSMTPAFPDPASAIGKAAAPHLTLNYVEIYEEQPGTYQP